LAFDRAVRTYGGAGAAAELAGAGVPTAAQLGVSPEFGILGVPGLKTTRIWVGRDQRDTRDSPRAQAGYGEALGGARKDDGGTARRGLSVQAVWVVPIWG